MDNFGDDFQPEENNEAQTTRSNKTPEVIRPPSKPTNTRTFGTPNKEIDHKSPVQAAMAIDDLKSFKNKKKIEQSVQDMEDTIVRDTIKDRKMMSPPIIMPSNNYNYKPVTTSLDLNTSEIGINAFIKRDRPYKELMEEVLHIKYYHNHWNTFLNIFKYMYLLQ
jgi:hypothetical protein